MTAMMINLFIITYMIFIIAFYFLHQTIQEHINELNYNVTEVVSTTGVLSRDLYTYLSDQANKYGDYRIKMKLEKQIKPGIYDTFYNEAEIIDQSLRIGDRLTIYLEDQNLTLFGRLLNATLLGYSPEELFDAHIRSIKTVVVAKDARYLVKGYDVITDIADKAADDTIAILVSTKRNALGKYYGADSHTDVPLTNRHYGDSSDEKDITGDNYIFVDGDFIKQVEYDPSTGLVKLIKYLQQ